MEAADYSIQYLLNTPKYRAADLTVKECCVSRA